MSFIVPLIVSEHSLTSSQTILRYIPYIAHRFTAGSKLKRNLLLSSFLLGLVGMFNLDPGNALLSGLSGIAFVLLMVHLFRWKYPRRRKITEYVPTRNEFRVLLALLLFIYFLFGAIYNVGYLLNGFAVLFTLVLYIILFLLLRRNLVISWKARPGMGIRVNISIKFLLVLIGVFILTTTIEAMLPFKMLIFFVLFIAESLVGSLFLIHSLAVSLGKVPKFLRILG
jgi:hypothetical protein